MLTGYQNLCNSRCRGCPDCELIDIRYKFVNAASLAASLSLPAMSFCCGQKEDTAFIAQAEWLQHSSSQHQC